MDQVTETTINRSLKDTEVLLGKTEDRCNYNVEKNSHITAALRAHQNNFVRKRKITKSKN